MRGNAYSDGPCEHGVDPRSLPVARRVSLLVNALDGAQRTNEALAACANGERNARRPPGSIDEIKACTDARAAPQYTTDSRLGLVEK